MLNEALLFFIASHYSPGIMQEVVANRQSMAQLPEIINHDQFVAVRDCEHIGEVMWIAPIGYPWEMFIIADCSRPPGTDGAYEWMTDNNILVEVDFLTAQRWGSVGGGIKIERMHQGPRIER